MKINIETVILGILVFIYIVLCSYIKYVFAEDYTREENKIRNQHKEYEAIVYYKDGEKLKTEYIEGQDHSVKYSSSETLEEAKELNADKVVFIHNHPGNSIETSPNDIKQKEITDKKFDKVNINTEHIVVTRNNERRY